MGFKHLQLIGYRLLIMSQLQVLRAITVTSSRNVKVLLPAIWTTDMKTCHLKLG